MLHICRRAILSSSILAKSNVRLIMPPSGTAAWTRVFCLAQEGMTGASPSLMPARPPQSAIAIDGARMGDVMTTSAGLPKGPSGIGRVYRPPGTE